MSPPTARCSLLRRTMSSTHMVAMARGSGII
jgi:hypothetical protein